MLINLLVVALAAAAYADETYDDPQTWSNRQTMVHLFEWKWTDIAKECETFLPHYGYGAVQVSPPMEHIWLVKDNTVPWWVRYQPVSYKLQSRSGSRSEFIDMVNRCNKVGVRIIVDGVFNHMVGVGHKRGENGISSSGECDFNGHDGVETFPCIGYTKDHFNDWRCHRDITTDDYKKSAENVRNCRLTSLLDLNQESHFVRTKILDFLNELIGLGVAGFRMDAMKHMWPGDWHIILKNMTDLRSDLFGENKRPFIVDEVIDMGGEIIKCDEYVDLGRYTDFNYGMAVSKAMWKDGTDFSHMVDLKHGYGYGNLASHDVLAFIDNHDNQRAGNVLTHTSGNRYPLAVGFMLAWDYGYPRVMSSYAFTFSNEGPPNLGADHGYATKSPTFNAQYKTCEASSGWVCEHRWAAIRGMARFRSEVMGTAVGNIHNSEYDRLAFSRVGKGFFAGNNGDHHWNLTAHTSLPAGAYCDVWSGELQNGACTGLTVNVKSDGTAHFYVPSQQFMAIHTGWKL